MVSAARGGARRRQGVRVETDGAGATRAVAVARRGGVALVLRAGMGYGRVGKATQPRRERRAAACHPLRCSHLDGDTVLCVRRNAAGQCRRMDGMEQLLGNYSALTPSTRATGDGVQTTNNTYTRRFKKTNKREADLCVDQG